MGKTLRMEEEMALLKKEIKHLKGEKENNHPSHVEVEILHKGKNERSVMFRILTGVRTLWER